MNDDKFVVRLWDYYDGWIDISGPLSKEAAQERWNQETQNGTVKAKEDFRRGYYMIFPANTKMIYDSEFMDR